MRKDDIFNPTYRSSKKDLLRKNLNKIILFVIVGLACSYGAYEYIERNTMMIEIRTVKGKKLASINWMLEGEGEIYKEYQIENKSPFPIKLLLNNYSNHTNSFFGTNYNETILNPKTTYYFYFYFVNDSNRTISCGFDIEGERT